MVPFLFPFPLVFSHIVVFSLAIGSGCNLAKAEMQGCDLVFPPRFSGLANERPEPAQ